MPHANASLTERGRLRLARCVVDDGWPLRRAADRFQVAVATAKRWADRYRIDGPDAMSDRPRRRTAARPGHPGGTGRQVLHLRRTKRLGPAGSAGAWAFPPLPATRFCGGPVRLTRQDRATAEPVRRYETPGNRRLVVVRKSAPRPVAPGQRSCPAPTPDRFVRPAALGSINRVRLLQCMTYSSRV